MNLKKMFLDTPIWIVNGWWRCVSMSLLALAVMHGAGMRLDMAILGALVVFSLFSQLLEVRVALDKISTSPVDKRKTT